MNKEIKELWLIKLRGGLYKQTKGVLRNNDNECCCLGVLCDLIAPEEWIPSPLNGGWEHENHQVRMPYWGMTDKAGVTQDQVGVLAEMNDSGVKFAEIADYIERHL